MPAVAVPVVPAAAGALVNYRGLVVVGVASAAVVAVGDGAHQIAYVEAEAGVAVRGYHEESGLGLGLGGAGQ
jgi:hypothetical protein